VKTSFCGANLRGAEISFADPTGADFRQADLADVSMYRTETMLAHFEDSLLNERSDIPGRKVLEIMRMIA
jgi:uncharacterized protein YjbI with pentapeptide repeats